MSKSNCWNLAERALQKPDLLKRVMLYGPVGTGKTTAAVKSNPHRPVYSVTLTEDMSVAELLGHYVPKENEFVWHDGAALRAWREGATLVLNEIDYAAGPIQTALLAILDDNSIASLTIPTGETVKPHPNFRAVATLNGSPDGLSQPLSDRFDVTIYIDYPHPSAVAKLDSNLQQIAINSYSNLKDEYNADLFVSLRRFYAYSNCLDSGFSEEDAAQMSFGKRWRDVLNCINLGPR